MADPGPSTRRRKASIRGKLCMIGTLAFCPLPCNRLRNDHWPKPPFKFAALYATLTEPGSFEKNEDKNSLSHFGFVGWMCYQVERIGIQPRCRVFPSKGLFQCSRALENGNRTKCTRGL